MSDLKIANKIRVFFQAKSNDSSSEAQNSDVTIQNMNQEIAEVSDNEQFENLVGSNKAFVTKCNNAPEKLQSKEIGQDSIIQSLMPHEPVQAPTNELPRNKGIAPAAPSQPSKRPRRLSPMGIAINDVAAEETVPRRSPRIRYQIDADPRYEGLRATYSYLGKRPLYMDNKRDEYEWYFPDYSDEDEDY